MSIYRGCVVVKLQMLNNNYVASQFNECDRFINVFNNIKYNINNAHIKKLR